MSGDERFLDKHYCLLRRLHSLTGIVPIGAFLIMHLTTNSSVVWGALNARADKGADLSAIDRGVATFQHEVHFINELPLLLLTEIFVLWLPIAFHSIFGLYIAMSGSNNVARYPYQDNKRYVLQRLTGYIGFVFILYHIATLRWGWSWLTPSDTSWSHEFAASTLAAALKGNGGQWTAAGVAIAIGYFVGVSALVFHLANGLWTAAITWGLTITEQAQQRWGFVCAALGGGLMLAAWSALFGFLFLVDAQNAEKIEHGIALRKYGPAFVAELETRLADQPEALARAVERAADWPYPGPPPELDELSRTAMDE